VLQLTAALPPLAVAAVLQADFCGQGHER
jgi:hypothetical protein